MERLLRYSLEHRRPVRIIWEEEGKMYQCGAQVEALTETTVELTTTRPKRRVTLPLTALLAVDYRKSDRDIV